MSRHHPHRHSRRRRGIAILLGLVAATAVAASAASLGGIDSQELGADTEIVASCDTNGMDVEYRTAFHRPSGEYRVNRVILRFVSEPCSGLPYQLTLFDDDGGEVEVGGSSLLVRNIRDRQPGPGVDRAGVVSLVIRNPVENVDGIAVVIGGTASP